MDTFHGLGREQRSQRFLSHQIQAPAGGKTAIVIVHQPTRQSIPFARLKKLSMRSCRMCDEYWPRLVYLIDELSLKTFDIEAPMEFTGERLAILANLYISTITYDSAHAQLLLPSLY